MEKMRRFKVRDINWTDLKKFFKLSMAAIGMATSILFVTNMALNEINRETNYWTYLFILVIGAWACLTEVGKIRNIKKEKQEGLDGD